MMDDKEENDRNSSSTCVNTENKKNKKSLLENIRSIKIYSENYHESSSDDENDIYDIVHLTEISSIKRKEDKFYQHLLPIENGIYNGTINEKFLREGQGTYSINNGEEYYSGEWKDDQPNGYGYNFKNHGSTIYHGEFHNGILKDGYGKIQLSDQYEYEGKIKNGKFHGLGSLSIQVSGLTDINRSSVQKDVLELVAKWKENRTEFVYSNEIEEYYQNQYEVFQNSLESIILLSNEHHDKQRENLQVLFALSEKHLSDLNLLNDISTNPILPRELKSSANLLYKLDHSYTNLNKYTQIEMKKSYNEYINHICQRGLKNYIKKLTWVEDENQIDLISSKTIFENDLNQFLEKSHVSEMKSILAINTNVVNLIKKLIRFANGRLIQIPLHNRDHFIRIHTKFLQELWKNYFQKLDYHSLSNRFKNDDDEKYYFYFECYLILLDLSIIDELEIEIESKRFEQNQTICSIVVKRNEEILYREIPNNNQFRLIIIVLDGKIGTIKTERVFTQIEIDPIRFIEEINPDDIIISIFSNNTDKPLNIDIKNIFKNLNSIEISQLKKNMRWVFLIRKKDRKIYQKISSNFTEQLLIKENMNESNIESIIYQVMRFALFHLKPWMDIPIQDCSKFLGKILHQDISINEIEDELLIKILQDSKNHILDMRTDTNEYFSRSLESMIDYYQKSLLKDKYLSYQSKMKEMKKIFDFFIQISVNDSSQAQAITELQLKSIREFIEEKQSITETIDHFLHFNSEFFKLSQIFQKHFPPKVHRQFHGNTCQILSLITDIFKLILQKEIHRNQNEFENKLFAMQKFNNFLTNLASLDFSWFVEGKKIKIIEHDLFEKIGEKDIYKVLQIDKAKMKVNDPCPHYVLDAIKELLEIIKNVSLIDSANTTELIKIRAELLMAVGKSFKYFNDQIKYNNLAKFKEDCVVPFQDVMVDNESYEIFREKLDKIDLYFLYSRKLKEITLDQALKLFQERNNNSFDNKKIEEAFRQYEELFQTYFHKITKRRTTIKEITEKTKEDAKKSIFKRKIIPNILAGLSIVLSLRVSNFLEERGGEYVLKEKYNENYLLQPHCIQILGILMLLDVNGNKDSLPPNHLAEILTGQGKSWALALLAGYFSLIGYQVTVGCYSNYLSQRDENDFKENLEPFHFQNSVRYQTFETMCVEKISIKNTKKTLRDIISDIISGEKLFPSNIKDSKKEKTIFLIDEVDVFFSNQFGQMYCPVVTIKNKNLVQIQKDIWKYLMTEKSHKSQLQNYIETKIFSLANNDQMLTNLVRSNTLKNHLQEMIDTARKIYNDINKENLFKEKFKIIDNIICAKDSDGKYCPNTIYRYENSFYYLKLMYKKDKSFQEVELNEENFGYLLITCGYISYSELPNSFNGIFGVSGSLKDLSGAENSLLTHYDIDKKSYYPSFFGQTKLKFNRINDFIIKNYKKHWFDHIITSTRRRIAEERSVLIFFQNEKLLDEFYTLYSRDLGVIPYFITQNKTFDSKNVKNYHDNDVNRLIQDEYAGHHGKVTLLTREFGRGVDFQSEAKVNEKGGTHVIQTFFSEDIKEEIQIKGRTARKDELGSYELILCLEHLLTSESEGEISIEYTNVTKDTTYDQLDDQRKNKMNLFCQAKLKTIKNNLQIHYRTLLFFQRALTECNDQNREKFIQEIEQLKILD